MKSYRKFQYHGPNLIQSILILVWAQDEFAGPWPRACQIIDLVFLIVSKFSAIVSIWCLSFAMNSVFFPIRCFFTTFLTFAKQFCNCCCNCCFVAVIVVFLLKKRAHETGCQGAPWPDQWYSFHLLGVLFSWLFLLLHFFTHKSHFHKKWHPKWSPKPVQIWLWACFF